MFDTASQELAILAEALLALVLGGLIGFEREAAGKWAKLRTHMLVCLAAFLFVEIGEVITLTMAASWAAQVWRRTRSARTPSASCRPSPSGSRSSGPVPSSAIPTAT